MNNLKETDHHVTFKFNDTPVSSDLIGTLSCNFKGIRGKMKLGIYESMNIGFNPSDMCQLPNGNIIFANYKRNNMSVFDTNINFVKNIDKLTNHYNIEPFSITTNNVDKIYICEYNYVTMTDLGFNYQKKFGTSKIELEDPRYILFHDEFLYVCDCSSMRIQKLSAELTLKATFLLDIKPRQMKIIDKIACIRSLHDGLYFYDLVNFQLKMKYGQTNGFILIHDYLFFQFRRETMEMDCFDKNGVWIESINLKLMRDVDFEGYFIAGFFNGKFILQSSYKKITIF
jgi:hypothetical protein